MRFRPNAAIRLLAAGVAATVLAACGTDTTAPASPAAPPDPLGAVVTGSTGPVTTQMNDKMCLDVVNGSNTNGAKVQLWSCSGGANQQWTPNSAGELRVFGTKCLDAPSGRYADGDRLQIYNCWSGGTNQRWQFTSAGEIRGQNGKCVDISGANATNGATIVLYTCNGGANQKWNTSGSTSPTSPSPTPTPSAGCSAYPTAARVVKVSGASQLASALSGARAGDRIELADGTYNGRFAITASGTSSQPIVICGSRSAVLNAGTLSGADVFSVKGSNYVTLAGFSVTNGLRGVYLRSASNNVITGLSVYGIGQAGIHLQVNSRNNRVDGNTIKDTGKHIAEYGEGIYVGTPYTQWSTYTGGQPDRSDNNRVVNNIIGPYVRSEGVDVKEGTTGGVLQGNTFDGTGMVMSKSWVDSWVEIKGNGWLVTGNRGSHSLRDGFQTYSVKTGWGNNNTFTANTANVGASGYGFRVSGSVTGDVVKCDNTVTNAGSGYANVRCQ